MSHPTRALVIGTGWAGKGHTTALRACGVDVVGLLGRSGVVVEQVARQLGVVEHFTELDRALSLIKPDIVCVATPGSTHEEFVSAALRADAHVICEKPLGTSVNVARRLHSLAVSRGLKHAYASTGRFAPTVQLAAKLIREDAIGTPQEVECISHYGMSRYLPFCWFHSISTGGGRLFNNFSHIFGIILELLGGTVVAASGETRNDLERAPVGAPIHDFRALLPALGEAADVDSALLTEAELANAEWRESDADWSYTAVMRVRSTRPDTRDASVLVRHAAHRVSPYEDHVVIYGTKGALYLGGAYAQYSVRLRKHDSATWTDLEVPASKILNVADPVLRNWTELSRRFVADVQGNAAEPYPTFEEGKACQAVIERVRQASLSPVGD